jgi:hypothetical protein
MKAHTWNLKTFLLVHKFSIKQSFPTPYFHIVFLTEMIWKKKDLKGRGPKQRLSQHLVIGYFTRTCISHNFNCNQNVQNQPHIMIIVSIIN